MYFEDSISEMTKAEVVDLMWAYNNYVMDFDYSHGGQPVSLMEFYDNDYQEKGE